MSEAGPCIVRVAATRRLAHSLRRGHDESCQAQGRDVWRTLDIVTWDELVERLFKRAREEGRMSGRWLSGETARLVWERIVRRDPATANLVAPDGLGRSAHRAWQLAHAYDIPPAALQSDQSPESVAFSRWCSEYVARLREEGWVDHALVTGGLEPPESGTALELVGFDVLTPAQQAFLQRIQQAGVAVTRRAPDARRGEARWVQCQDRRAEWDAAARWAAWRLDREPGVRLAIVVAGLRERRAEVRRAIERVLAPHAALAGGPAPGSSGFVLAAAGSLADRPVVASALDLVDAFTRPLDLPAASRLLRNPFLSLAGIEADARARLDAYIRRNENLDIGCERLTRLASERRCPGLEQALRAGTAAVRSWPSRASPSRWSRLWFELLAALGWPGEGLDSDEHQARQRWQSLLGEFGACDDYAGNLRPAEAASLVRELARGVQFEPQDIQAPLLVIDPETCGGMTFDGLWVCGLDAGRWPSPPSPDPFLPRDWQVRRGVPGASAEIAAAEAQRTLDRLRRSADEVILSVPSFDEEAPLLPSALLSDVPRGTIGDFWTEPSVATVSFATRPALEEKVDDRMPRRAGLGYARGGAYLLQLQAACPFRAQAEMRLGARALDDPETGLDAAERGDLLHAVLARLWHELGAQGALRRLSAAELVAVVRRVVAAETDTARQKAGGVMRHLLDIESGWLEARAIELLTADLARPPFAVEAIETGQEIAIGDLELSVRLDRVDRLEDGSLAVIDYKTGADADVDAWLGERPRLPQLPLYAQAAGRDRVAVVAFGRVRTGRTGYSGLARDAEIFPGLKTPGSKGWPEEFESWDGMLETWRRRLETMAFEFSAGDARLAPDPVRACRYCHLASLCRIGETRLSAELADAADG